MIIKLDEEWFIEDNGNYTLRKFSGKVNVNKEGKEQKVYDFENYPPSLESCLRHYARQKVISINESLELKEYIKQLNNTYNQILEILKESVGK